MVKRPLDVTTHTALGTPVSVNSTCSWPASGTGMSTEPRSSRANSATAGSSKSSISNGPSTSSRSPGSSDPAAASTSSPGVAAEVSSLSSLPERLPNAAISATPPHRFALHRHRRSQTRMSAGGTVTTVATGCFGQSGLVEGRDLQQLDQLDPLHQQLGDAVAAMHQDG